MYVTKFQNEATDTEGVKIAIRNLTIYSTTSIAGAYVVTWPQTVTC